MQVAGFLQGPYKIDNFNVNVKCVVTNKPPTGPIVELVDQPLFLQSKD